ncbi:hypothetical protein BKA70DRAFT_1420658 [Coprinopsis sp. MPI-PUGE-AT-0042]|nr:hypothetical protein BKA70DRAFT_1420658 [Coprinopsis sp. MPI-PUGE-AT-0042]
MTISRPSSPKTPSTPRYSTYLKRHASFSSPREIPLPPTPASAMADSYFSLDRQESASGSDLVDHCSAHFSQSSSLPPDPHIPFHALPERRPQMQPKDDQSTSSSSSGSSVGSSSSSTPSSSSSYTSAGSSTQHRQQEEQKCPESPASFTSNYSVPLPEPDYPTAMRRSSPSISFPGSLQPPEPPRILESEPEPSERIPAPYEFFLNSRGPAPADSWLEIETLRHEYRLFARLPGFSREGITLATKRRRILHLVADKWDNGGGHFERRISFGYDADLVQVRAEFDGEMLRVLIPRRQPMWSNSRLAYSGRV